MSASRRLDGAGPGPGEEWYADGLRFACTQCGNCCTGPPGAVWINDEEARAITTHLDLGLPRFRRRFARRLDGHWSLTERQTEHGYDCVFLDRDSEPGRTRCLVHPVRPLQCRTWPFWPENLHTPRSWKSTKLATPCPGMDSGPLVRIEEIRVQRDAMAGHDAPT